MAINFFKWKLPCLVSIHRVCSIAYRAVCRMSLVCSLFRTCLRNICRPASFAHTLNWNVFSTAADSWNTVELGFSFTSRNCGSSNMAGAGGPATMHSQIWKRMIALKRKLLGDSSVLPSAVLETVTKKTRTVLSQQSNSVEMSDYSSGDPEHPRSEQMDYITTPGTTVVVISEDSRQNLNAAEEHCVASASLVSDILPLGDELVALFDSDSHRKSSCSTTASSGASEFLLLLHSRVLLLHQGGVMRSLLSVCLSVTLSVIL